MSRLRKTTIFILSFYLFLFFLDLDDVFYSKLTNIINVYEGRTSLKLAEYEVTTEAKKVHGISDNLSDITYSNKTKSLFCILNSPRRIYELTLNGDIKREIILHGFKDTEGITFMYDNTFVISDERTQEFFLIVINSNTKEIYKKDVLKSFKLDNNSFKNFGYEGVAYNKNNKDFYLVNEKFPLQVITISNWLTDKNISISFDNELSSITNYVSDLSGVYHNPKNNNTLFLSHESMLLTEVNMKGERISFLDLEKGFAKLKNDIPQAEGVTMDEDNNIYIVSEPNLFYKFRRTKDK